MSKKSKNKKVNNLLDPNDFIKGKKKVSKELNGKRRKNNAASNYANDDEVMSEEDDLESMADESLQQSNSKVKQKQVIVEVDIKEI